MNVILTNGGFVGFFCCCCGCWCSAEVDNDLEVTGSCIAAVCVRACLRCLDYLDELKRSRPVSCVTLAATKRLI